MPASTSTTSTPCSRRRSREKRVFDALRVERPDEHNCTAMTIVLRSARNEYRPKLAARWVRRERLDPEVPALSVGIGSRARSALVSVEIEPAIMTSWPLASSVATPRFCSTAGSRSRPPRAPEVPITVLDDRRREALGGLVHDQEVGLVSSARPIASICCSPPESWAPPLLLALGEPREELVDAAHVHVPARRARCGSSAGARRSVSDSKSRRPWGTYAMPEVRDLVRGMPRISLPRSGAEPRACGG